MGCVEAPCIDTQSGRDWQPMTDEDELEVEVDSDKRLSMVDEALVAGTIANTNGLLVILAKLVAKGVFDRDDLKSFSDSYSKPLDHVGMRENELVTQMQDQMESTLAELMRYLSERELESLRFGERERVTDTRLPHIRELPRVLPGLFARAARRVGSITRCMRSRPFIASFA